MTVRLRRAGLHDLTPYIHLTVSARTKYNRKLRSYTEAADALQTETVYMIEEEGTADAVGVVVIVWQTHAAGLLRIHDFVVRGRCQNKGIGKEVLRLILTDLYPSATRVELFVHPKNEGGKRFFEREGFKLENVRPEQLETDSLGTPLLLFALDRS